MEPDRRIRRIAIVGGGVAGWTAAVMLGKKLGGQCSIHVVDAPEPRVRRDRPKRRCRPCSSCCAFSESTRTTSSTRRSPPTTWARSFVDWAAHGRKLLASVRRLRRADRAPAVLSLLAQGQGARAQAADRALQPGNGDGAGQPLHLPDELARRRAAPALFAARRPRARWRVTCASVAERAGVIRSSARLLARRAAKTASSTSCSSRTAANCAPTCSSIAAARAASSSARFSSRLTRTGSSGCPAIASCSRPARSKRRARRTCASMRARPAGSGAFRCSRI